ncbi:MAG: hypothetical protein A2945_02900 [Candidatus Liptonbacteria bacterium RIFCSPLOWO2_01_FULL_52_25]|uniref:Glycosidase n=1 Tax=Candidatus Liptonbacteria bacterium RIFCSPLOWO2_01_FULL_52_25 TaxID=1798650 RepID=A0A1G2CDU9_9BACT|nr:MAG: hypothetical protein A2945_02900 [Candidatus Liptonbacteria bacterium RIFCSPLOWO2_01_FULL_52_25]
MTRSRERTAAVEHPGKVTETDERFKRVMAITLNPASGYREGIVRCITSRSGDLHFRGNVDRSELHRISGDSLEHFEIKGRLQINNESEIVGKLAGKNDFIGLEDPDIWIDENTGLMHMYFTIPVRGVDQHWTAIHLGHAVGKDLDSLEMTEPALTEDHPELTTGVRGAKEVSIAPLNKNGTRHNLVEASERRNGTHYSVVRVATAKDMGKPWEYGGVAFHPAEHNIPWIAGHASPGPLLPRTFIDVGEGKMLGIMNGREANQKVSDKIKYGMFSVGLFIYDYENGKIDWVSPQPLIQDSQAETITFASQFVETKNGEGILYAHVDDSFVRAYTLNAEAIKSLLPSSFQ